MPAAGSSKLPATITTTPPTSDDVTLEQGKALYDQGQYLMALDKFMKVLRRDPHDPVARQYLTLVMDQLKAQRQNSANLMLKQQTQTVTGAAPGSPVPA